MGQARRIVSAVAVLLLFLPASTSIPVARWNLHLVSRLRDMHRIAPDSELDRTYRTLLPYLPAEGDIGFQSVDTSDDGRLFYRAQYALAPKQLRKSALPEFVIEVGPADAPESLSRHSQFHLVTSIHEGLRLYRKVQ